jgi:hypothetical protein
LFRADGVTFAANVATGEYDRFVNVETFRFDNADVSSASVPAFDAVKYLASSADLAAGIGLNLAAGAVH